MEMVTLNSLCPVYRLQPIYRQNLWHFSNSHSLYIEEKVDRNFSNLKHCDIVNGGTGNTVLADSEIGRRGGGNWNISQSNSLYIGGDL